MVLKNKQNKYENNKEGLQEQGRKKYRDLEIQKKKQKYRKKIYRREYERYQYKNKSEEDKEKIKEYQNN